MSRRYAYAILMISAMIIIMAAGGIFVEMSLRCEISKVNAKTREIGVFLLNGRRSASNMFTISSHDKSFDDDKIDKLLKIMEKWNGRSAVEEYSVDFRETNITDAGLKKLSEISKIRTIHISSQNITIEGIDEFLLRHPEPCEIYLTKLDNGEVYRFTGAGGAGHKR